MKQSVMWPLVRLNSGVHIGGACRRVGARDATARPWNTSLQDPSPPAGRLLDDTGLTHWLDGTSGGSDRFRHAFDQQVLYERLGRTRRAQLHQRMGARLEA